MNKWEYDTCDYYSNDLHSILNDLGFYGWEVIQVERRMDHDQKDYYHIIAKRCLQEQTTDGGLRVVSPESNY